jgi:hypothetical protein
VKVAHGPAQRSLLAALHSDPLDLGLIGLSQFLPFIIRILQAGHAATWAWWFPQLRRMDRLRERVG